MGWPEKIRHARVGDDELLAAASLSVKNARQQNAGVADEETARLEDDPEAGATHERAHHFPEMTDIHRTLGVVRDSEPTADVEILQSAFCIPLDLAPQVQQPLHSDFVRSELRDLGPDVHVETEEADILQIGGHFRNGERLVERDAELHPLLARPRVRVRSVHQHLRIHAERNGSDDAEPLRHSVEDVQLLLGLHVEEKDLGANRLFHLPRRFPNATEDDVTPGIARLERAKQLAAGNDIEARAQLAQKRENRNARIGFHAVVQSRVELPHRIAKQVVLLPDGRRAVDVAGSSDCARDDLE